MIITEQNEHMQALNLRIWLCQDHINKCVLNVNKTRFARDDLQAHAWFCSVHLAVKVEVDTEVGKWQEINTIG